jgi:hypothetical protein
MRKRWAGRIVPGVAFFLAMTAHLPVLAAASITYKAYVGVDSGDAGSGTIIGNGASGSGSNCTTYGSTTLQISPSLNSGFSVPSGGIGPCGYYGGAIDNVGSTSKTASTGSVTAAFDANSFTGSSTASSGTAAIGEFSLNATATGSYSGGLGPTTKTQSAARRRPATPIGWSLAPPVPPGRR